MSVEMYYLSLIRLAKHQIMSWGHPETTGSESIDFFLCSKSLITDETSKSYSEKLLLMDHLPMIYEMPKIQHRIKAAELSKKDIYYCPQTMFKFHPDFDHILAEILKNEQVDFIHLSCWDIYSRYRKVFFFILRQQSFLYLTNNFYFFLHSVFIY